MTIKITMPALSPTMTEGKLAKWHVKEGDTVKAGQVLCEIETDKATMEVEAVDEGTIGKLLIAEGTEGVPVNTPIAILLEEGEDKSAIKDAGAAPAAAKPAAPAPASAAPPAAAPKPVAPVAAPAPAAKPAPSAPTSSGERIFASPLAKRMAEQAKLDLSRIQGSGPHGRIVKVDIDKAVASGTGKAGAPATVSRPVSTMTGSRQDKLVPHTGVRKVIAKRLTEAKQQIPHIYLTVACRIDALIEARKQMNGKSEAIKVSVNDLIIKAAAMALRDHPDVNASWTDDAMLLHGAVDISVAVSSDRGLITPIVRDADLKGLAAISSEMRDLAKRARDGKLKLEEFQGGGFTISNMGMFGINEFSAIINPPQAAILAIGAGEDRAIVERGEIKVAKMMNVTLSADHRVIDGALGAQWLKTFKSYIERPTTMLL